jgi:hypothetical protein
VEPANVAFRHEFCVCLRKSGRGAGDFRVPDLLVKVIASQQQHWTTDETIRVRSKHCRGILQLRPTPSRRAIKWRGQGHTLRYNPKRGITLIKWDPGAFCSDCVEILPDAKQLWSVVCLREMCSERLHHFHVLRDEVWVPELKHARLCAFGRGWC